MYLGSVGQWDQARGDMRGLKQYLYLILDVVAHDQRALGHRPHREVGDYRRQHVRF
jgi:hypothetical protein